MLQGLDSHVRPPGLRHNSATEHFTGYVPQPRVDLRQAYVFARGVARIQADTAGQNGHRLIWVRGTSFGASTLVASDEAFAVVGRHTQCGVVLAEDPFVALRHVLVKSIALPAGGLALRVFDL